MREDRKVIKTGLLSKVDVDQIEKNIKILESELLDIEGDNFIDEILNVYNIHGRIFKDAVANAEMLGLKRQNALSVLYLTEGRVLQKTKMSSVEDIDRNILVFSEFLKKIYFDKPSKDELCSYLAASMHSFFIAHPFEDGNGRTLRFIFKVFCKRLGYTMDEKWSVIERPYNKHFCYAIRNYKNAPYLLTGALREYIEPAKREKDGYDINEGLISSLATLTRPTSRSDGGGAFAGVSLAAVDCADCSAFLEPTQYAQCMQNCGGGGGGGGGDDGGDDGSGQSFLDWLTSILDRT